ncbi:hypothetical protein T12_10984 [Trichinella patagoniensis]|uniref:Uncharacterized protein n=1 Tax=Trichinella patagoniensis TaxID=990121 RepID=A0A0V0YVW2_9BILA|nr:hypothetical protein T12_10984 [Trichinella patagoniensis]
MSSSLATRIHEVVQKTIRLVDVVETLMLFQERDVLNYVITTMCSGDAQLLNNQVIRICSRI